MHKSELLPNIKHIPPYIDKPPQLEPNPLPPHLRYTFLGENQILLMIVSAKLNKE